MVSKSIYWQLIFRVVLVTITAMAMAFLYFEKHFIGAIFLLLTLIFQTNSLIQHINQTNRKIAYFFDAIKNEDFTLRFPEKLSVKSLQELNHSLNTVNKVIQDIHLKKEAQEQYYLEIIKQADIGILTFNSKGHILFANSKIETLFNYQPLNHIKQLKKVDEKLYTLFSSLKPFDRKLIQLSNEREKQQIAIKSTEISMNGQELVLVVAQDIHQELDEKETDSWVRLIRVLTHEIMNSITPITSISESVLKYFKNGSAPTLLSEFTEDQLKNTAKGLEVIKEQGNDLMTFVQSYRSFLSLPKPDLSLVSAIQVLEKIKILMSSEEVEQNNISFEIEAIPTNLELYIDEKQISQILINLSKNALQSIGDQERGAIKITAGQYQDQKKYISVWDNGPGIPKDLLEEIFIPFFTTKNTGTGIGLSLSKQIMHLHGGSIGVISQKNSTCFTLVFK